MPVSAVSEPTTSHTSLHQSRRHVYVIGDLQGCFATLKTLLKTIEFDSTQDFIYFAGDLVARGEDSLGCLRFVRKLQQQGAAATVLGNHDLTLLACGRGLKKVKEKDKTLPILEAVDCSALLDWLRQQPLMIEIDHQHVLVHAGIPHIWTITEARSYAQEVERALTSDLKTLDQFLSQMYGTLPNRWEMSCTGMARLRMITNYLTRMRLIGADGTLELDFKSGLDDCMPKGFAPWFNFSRMPVSSHRILFGHWAALQAQSIHPNVIALDGGCVWGQDLVAYRLHDGQVYRVKNTVLNAA